MCVMYTPTAMSACVLVSHRVVGRFFSCHDPQEIEQRHTDCLEPSVRVMCLSDRRELDETLFTGMGKMLVSSSGVHVLQSQARPM